jgi:DNA invertase Pin-like site-specific DNA recombinase
MSRKQKVEAVAYLRTSSSANVGEGKDSDRRQRKAIEAFAKRAGFEIVGEFYDPAVSGADRIEVRPGFAALLDKIEGNGVRTVIVEDASRFARELMAQELGIVLLNTRKVRLLTASGDDLTASEDPSRKMMRQIAGSFAEYEKARLVDKLRGARERARAEQDRLAKAGKPAHKTLKGKGKCGGRKSLAETSPEAVLMAKRLRRANPKTGECKSFQRIARELAEHGRRLEKGGKPELARQFLRANGEELNPATIKAMVDGPRPARRDAGDAKSED